MEHNPAALGRHAEKWDLSFEIPKRGLKNRCTQAGLAVSRTRDGCALSDSFTIDLTGLRTLRSHFYISPFGAKLVVTNEPSTKGDMRISASLLAECARNIPNEADIIVSCHYDREKVEPVLSVPKSLSLGKDSALAKAWGKTEITGLELTFDSGLLALSSAFFYLSEHCLHLSYQADLTLELSNAGIKTVEEYMMTAERFFVKENQQ